MHKFAADDFRGIGGESLQENPPYGVKNVSSDITSDIDLKHGLGFILSHFLSSSFPSDHFHKDDGGAANTS